MHPPVISETMARDDGFVRRLETCLQIRLGSQLRDFRVMIHADGLILQGRTRTYYGKQLAQHVAMDLSDRTVVANEIEVI